MVVVPDKQGYACKSQDEFEGYDKDVLHNGNFYNVHTLDADGLSTQFVGYFLSNSLTAVVNYDN